jgi:hypothetical protein
LKLGQKKLRKAQRLKEIKEEEKIRDRDREIKIERKTQWDRQNVVNRKIDGGYN